MCIYLEEDPLLQMLYSFIYLESFKSLSESTFSITILIISNFRWYMFSIMFSLTNLTNYSVYFQKDYHLFLVNMDQITRPSSGLMNLTDSLIYLRLTFKLF